MVQERNRAKVILTSSQTASSNKNDTIICMIKGNFLGAAIVAIIYTIYILWNPLPTKWHMASVLVVLNALTIVLMSFAFR